MKKNKRFVVEILVMVLVFGKLLAEIAEETGRQI